MAQTLNEAALKMWCQKQQKIIELSQCQPKTTCQFIILVSIVMNRIVSYRKKAKFLLHFQNSRILVSEKLPLTMTKTLHSAFLLQSVEFIVEHCKAIMFRQIFGKIFQLIIMGEALGCFRKIPFHNVFSSFLIVASKNLNESFLQTMRFLCSILKQI